MNVLGIDLGTYNSAAAVLLENGELRAISSQDPCGDQINQTNGSNRFLPSSRSMRWAISLQWGWRRKCALRSSRSSPRSASSG